MDPLDQRIPIEQVLGQEKKWLDAVKLASVIQKDRDPVFANNVVWLIHNGYIPRMSDQQYQLGSRVLPPGWQRVTSTNHLITGRLWVFQDMTPGSFIAR